MTLSTCFGMCAHLRSHRCAHVRSDDRQDNTWMYSYRCALTHGNAMSVSSNTSCMDKEADTDRVTHTNTGAAQHARTQTQTQTQTHRHTDSRTRRFARCEHDLAPACGSLHPRPLLSAPCCGPLDCVIPIPIPIPIPIRIHICRHLHLHPPHPSPVSASSAVAPASTCAAASACAPTRATTHVCRATQAWHKQHTAIVSTSHQRLVDLVSSPIVLLDAGCWLL